MTLVVDSSVAASWGLPDENSAAAAQALAVATHESVIVPTIFWHELRNVFLVGERRNRLTPEQTSTGLRAVGDLDPEVDASGQNHTVLDLARRHQLTAYDAAYLELAIRIGATMATLDARLAQAAKAEELVVIAPPS